MESRQLLSTFTVTSSADSGAGSFREAILSADKTSGASTIAFKIGTGEQTISLKSALPIVTVPLTIDGTTQPGFAGRPLITLDGTSAGSGAEGLQLAGGKDVVLGLAINNFSDCGIVVSGNNNTISGNYIGINAAGTKAAGNGGSGVKINSSSSGNTIGGTTEATRNVISSNGWANAYNGRGVWLNGSAKNTIKGNYFGTNAAGTAAVPNYGDDICLIGAANNTIGGTAAGAGNLISGSGRVGIWMNASSTTNNTIQGNLIGTDVTGTKALGNQITGIMLTGAIGNVIGGTTAAARNVISGNLQAGVLLQPGSSSNVIQGNYIGTNSAGTAALANVGSGIKVDSGSNNNTISSNLIAGNKFSGIDLIATTGDVITGNLIGTDVTGTKRLGNGQNGITVELGSHAITISGSNLISGNNWDGILVNGISSAGTGSVTIQGNKIGTSLDGTKAVLNGGNGVQVMWNATNVVIGGTNSKKSNLISGNARDGVHIFKATGNVVLGNRIGTDITGKLALANQYNGVYLGSANNTVGGPSENSGNVIAGNGTNGIWVNGGTKVTTNGVVFDTSGNTSGTVIAGNRIGVNIAGATLSNGNDGVYLTSPGEIQLGGTRERSSNIIAGRAGNGSYASSSTSTSTSTRTATATSMSNTGGWSIEVCGTTTLVLTNNQLLTVTATVDQIAKTITVGSQKGKVVYTLTS